MRGSSSRLLDRGFADSTVCRRIPCLRSPNQAIMPVAPLAAPPTDAAVCGGGDVGVGRVLCLDGEGFGAVEGQHLGRGHQAAPLKHGARHRLPVLLPAAGGAGRGRAGQAAAGRGLGWNGRPPCCQAPIAARRSLRRMRAAPAPRLPSLFNPDFIILLTPCSTRLTSTRPCTRHPDRMSDSEQAYPRPRVVSVPGRTLYPGSMGRWMVTGVPATNE